MLFADISPSFLPPKLNWQSGCFVISRLLGSNPTGGSMRTERLTDAEVKAIKVQSRNGFSYKDIAKLHDIPEKAVRYLLKRKI